MDWYGYRNLYDLGYHIEQIVLTTILKSRKALHLWGLQIGIPPGSGD